MSISVVDTTVQQNNSQHTQQEFQSIPSLQCYYYTLFAFTEPGQAHQQQVSCPDINYSKSMHNSFMTYGDHHINYEPFDKAKRFVPPVFYLPSIHLLNQLGMLSSQEWISSALQISYLHMKCSVIFFVFL